MGRTAVAGSEDDHNAEHIDSMLDDIIKNFMAETNIDPQRKDPLAAAFADGALAAMSRLIVNASEIEKALLAEILAARIAAALAPALAQALAPEILTVLAKAEPERERTPGRRE
jgi:hypothetical protein